MTRISRLLAVALLVAGGLVAAAPAQPAAAATGVPVMGPSRINPQQFAAWFASKQRAPRLAVSVEQLATLFMQEGNAEQVRWDVALAQSILETQYFEYPGSGKVRPEHHNYAGIGACDSCVTGTVFPDPRTGVRAQIQHLRNYADPTSRSWNLANPPILPGYDTFFKKGVAPTWNQMGNGNWATSTTYSASVLRVYNEILIFSGQPGECPPDGLAFGAAATRCPAAQGHPGRAVAAHPACPGFYLLNGNGAVTARNGAPFLGQPVFPWDIARDIVRTPDCGGYLVLDGFGGVHGFGSANSGALTQRSVYWRNWDIARSLAITNDGGGFAVLDAWGGVHPVGNAPGVARSYWPGWDIARALAFTGDRQGTYVLDGWGGVHTAGTAAFFGSPYWPGWDIARDLEVYGDVGYGVLDGWGGVHSFGAVRAAFPIGWAPGDRWRGMVFDAVGILALRNDGYAVYG